VARLARAGVADTGAFLARVVRLDPEAVVRLRPAGPGALALWSRLPFGVLVTRCVPAEAPHDAVVGAAALLSTLASLADPVPGVPPEPAPVDAEPAPRPAADVPARPAASARAEAAVDRLDAGTGGGLEWRLPASRPTDWRWPLPGVPGSVVESIPAGDILRIDAAAADTVRTASAEGVGGRAVGSRALRDALLDHVPIVVTTGAGDRVPVPQRLVQAVVRMGFVPPASSVRVRVAGGWTGLSGAFGDAWYRPPLLLR
jgi:hypothetical protein